MRDIRSFFRIGLLVLLLFSLSGCGGEKPGLLHYQSRFSHFDLIEEGSGRGYRVTPGEELRVTLIAPEAVAGITFLQGADGVALLSSGEIRLAVPPHMLTGARRAAGCLALTEEMLTGVESDPPAGADWQMLARFRGAEADYTVALDALGMPLWIEAADSIGVCRFAVVLPPAEGD